MGLFELDDPNQELEAEFEEIQRAASDLLGGTSRATGKGMDQPRKEVYLAPALGREVGLFANPEMILVHVVQNHQEAVIRSQRSKGTKPIIQMFNEL